MNRDSLSERDVLAVTLWGEARGEAPDGRLAVANVIRNRVQSGKWGRSYREVCLAPYQFSCWSPAGGVQNATLVDGVVKELAMCARVRASLAECQAIADAVMHDEAADNTEGASHYMTVDLYASPEQPRWARGMVVTARIGRHVFLREAV